jgi:hypothetical protein
VEQLQLRNDQWAFDALGRKMRIDRNVLRHGEKLISQRQCSIQTLSLVLGELQCVVILHSRIIIGGWPIFNVSCPHIGERGCPSFAGFANLGTSDPDPAGGFTRPSRPLAPPSGG